MLAFIERYQDNIFKITIIFSASYSVYLFVKAANNYNIISHRNKVFCTVYGTLKVAGSGGH